MRQETGFQDNNSPQLVPLKKDSSQADRSETGRSQADSSETDRSETYRSETDSIEIESRMQNYQRYNFQ